jgi:hypothetical protein
MEMEIALNITSTPFLVSEVCDSAGIVSHLLALDSGFEV